MILQIWNFPCFARNSSTWDNFANRNITLADPILFRWEAGNSGSQSSVSFLITWWSSRHCCNVNTGDYIYKKKAAFNTLIKVFCVSTKQNRGLVSWPTQNRFATRIWVATPRLIATGLTHTHNRCTWNKALCFCIIFCIMITVRSFVWALDICVTSNSPWG